MGRFNFTGLEDKDIIACYVLANTEKGGKVNEIEFARLLDQRRGQVKEELITLEQEIEGLGISDKDFQRMQRVYLTSKSENCSLKMAEEIIVKLDEKRAAGVQTDLDILLESMKVPSYASPNPKNKVETAEKGQKEEHQGEVEWVRVGTVKLQSLKKKFQRR